MFGTSAQSLTHRYTDDLPFKTAIPGCSTQCQIYRALINKTTTDPDFVNNAGSFTNFIQRLLGDEAAHFIYDFERLKSYHQDANDAAFFMDTYQWSSRYDGPRAYPDEGMSQFPIRMLARFQSLGGQFFPNTRITQVNEESSGNFVLQSGDAVQFNAAKVALAFPSYDYTGLGGNVIDRIRLTPEFQSASPNPCVTVQQVFGKRFFSFFLKTPKRCGPTASGRIERQCRPGFKDKQYLPTASTRTLTYSRHQQGFVGHLVSALSANSSLEFRYTYDRNITRSVYTDDLVQTIFWQRLFETQGVAGVELEAIRGLQAFFPNITIPKPLHTSYYYTPGIHTNQKTGSYKRGLTNAHIRQWASSQPVSSIPACKLLLASDTWNPKYVGWAMAGWSIVIDWFKACEGGLVIDPDVDYCKPFTGAPVNRTWCDCRPGVPIPPEGLAYISQNCPRAKRGEEKDNFVPDYTSIDG